MLRRILLTAAVPVVLLANGAGAQVVPGAPNTDWNRAHNEFTLNVLREFNTVVNQWRDGLNGKDGRQAASLYTASAQLLISGRDPVQGRDSIAVFLKDFAAQLQDIRFATSDFQASDKLAYATGPIILSLRDSASARVSTAAGRHVTILVREGRNWRIHSQVLQYLPAPADAGSGSLGLQLP